MITPNNSTDCKDIKLIYSFFKHHYKSYFLIAFIMMCPLILIPKKIDPFIPLYSNIKNSLSLKSNNILNCTYLLFLISIQISFGITYHKFLKQSLTKNITLFLKGIITTFLILFLSTSILNLFIGIDNIFKYIIPFPIFTIAACLVAFFSIYITISLITQTLKPQLKSITNNGLEILSIITIYLIITFTLLFALPNFVSIIDEYLLQTIGHRIPFNLLNNMVLLTTLICSFLLLHIMVQHLYVKVITTQNNIQPNTKIEINEIGTSFTTNS
jgi:hypothetical protein